MREFLLWRQRKFSLLLPSDVTLTHYDVEEDGEIICCPLLRIIGWSYFHSQHKKYTLYIQGTTQNLAFFLKQFKCYITPFKEPLRLKIGWVLKNSGSSLYDGHWNFPIWTIQSWENQVTYPTLKNHHQSHHLYTWCPTKN